MGMLIVLGLMAYLGLQVAGWVLYGVVLFKSGESYEANVHRDREGREI